MSDCDESMTGEFCGDCYGINLGCLDCYRRSLGFTQDDVEVLRQLPTYIRGLGLGADPEGVGHYIDGLADRIAALLPPEPAVK